MKVAIAIGILLAAGAAQAQPARRDIWTEMEQDNQRRTAQAQAALRPTRAEVIGNSLADLLSTGWQVASMTPGAMGPSFLLFNLPAGQKKWVLCDLRAIDGLNQLADQPVSRCMALN